MPDPRWDRLWDLFHAGREMDALRRARYLEEECGGDEALRREVAALLESHDASGPLDNSLAAAAAPVGAAGLRPGDRVGRFVLQRLLGEGGMGIVYEAEQQEPVRRRVALKVLHPGVHPDAAARFAVERQALALMSHPNIARVFDAGVTPDGRPFIAMEHVAGVPLNEYCDRHALDLGARLALFLSVCQAIQHAHQKGVIHRDVKPSNVLVCLEDDVPTVKVIDFGVAKTTGLDGPRASEEMLVGTLEYMSPEQLDPSGLDIDTRSDIYSLGVVLYELLAGTLPFDWPSLRSAGLEGLRRLARESEAPPASRRLRDMPADRKAAVAASRRTTAAALERRLTDDLDSILLKALDRDRTRRYGAASELALDLRRHLAHEPVHAGPARAPYRLAKFVRRHRAAVAGAGAGAVVLVAFAVGTVVQSLEVRRALARADRERARAERVSRFLVDVFQAADPFEGGGREVTARAVLDRGAQRVSEELAGEPDVQASVMSAVGRVYSQLRVYDSAERLLRDALALRRQLHAGDHAEVAQSLEELAWVLRLRADTAGAGALLEEAVAMRRRLDPPDPRLAHSLFLLGSLRRQEGKPEAAGALLDEALRLHGAPPAGAGAALPDQGARAAILEEMGNLAAARGDYAAAETRFREALAVRRQDRGRDAPLTAAALGRLGRLLSERGDLEAAEPLLREALAMLERHLGPDHEGLAAPLNNLGLTLQNRGDYAGAEPLYRRALGISKRLHGDAHPSVAVNLNNLGLLFHDQGRFAEAERFFIEALAVQRRVLRPDHPDLAYPTTNLARVLHDQGRLAEAEALYRQGLALRRRGLAPANPALADSLAWLGKLQAERGRGLEGEAMLREAVALRAAAFTSDDWRTAEARSLLGGCLTVLGRHAEAEPLLVESYPVLERRRGRNYRRTREAGQRVIALYEAWGRPAEAARQRARLGLSAPGPAPAPR